LIGKPGLLAALLSHHIAEFPFLPPTCSLRLVVVPLVVFLHMRKNTDDFRTAS
jgi:hypothetical protein